MELTPVTPFEPIATDRIPAGGSWIAQIKWDGVRMLTYYDGRQVRLINRRLNERTMQYPELQRIGAYCTARSVILDGEIIAFDEKKPSFHEVMKRDSLRKTQNIEIAVGRTPVTYMVFDVLYCNGEWVTDKPLAERQSLLQSIVTPLPNVQLTQNFPDGEALFGLMNQHGMEGIVAKDLTSAYVPGGKDKRWQKRKIVRDLIAVVGGVTFRDGIVNALILGLYDKGNLFYIGHAGAGKMTVQDWRQLTERTRSMVLADKPFANEPERSKEAVWIEPALTVKVQFLEWTPYGTMRQPVIQSFVQTPPGQCTFSQSM